jgi:hypothetical protein
MKAGIIDLFVQMSGCKGNRLYFGECRDGEPGVLMRTFGFRGW